jgi:hypothetical protein
MLLTVSSRKALYYSKGMPSNSPTIFASMSGFVVMGIAAIVIALLTGLAIAWVYIAQRMTQERATDLGLCVAVILSGVISVMLFVCMFCSTIHPTERFADMSGSLTPPTPTDTLLNGIADAEQKVCELVGRTDKFIESDVGKPGQDDPSLVVAAQRRARATVPGGRLVDCTVGSPEATLAEADARLTLLENTLKWFTGPELDATYKKAMAGCESYVDFGGAAPVVDLPALQTRLDTINAEIADQHNTRLDPMDKQTERLNRGEVSDCQKKMGAGAGADAAAAAKRPPAGTPLSD